jgi:hypothetical protein
MPDRARADQSCHSGGLVLMQNLLTAFQPCNLPPKIVIFAL